MTGGARWADSHCHLQTMDDPAGLLARAREAGVGTVVAVGTDLATSRAAIELAATEPQVRATVGLHPHDASRLEEEWDALVEVASADGVVGIGEAGFDLHYRHSEPDDQEEAFRRQIALATALDLALVIHTREAWDDTFRVLDAEGPPRRVVFHCFTGGPDEARRALELGAYLSFSGIVTFDGADDVRAAASVTPVDRVLVETDAPYLTPVPYRGRTNEPAYVVHVGEVVARECQLAVTDLAAAVSTNTDAVFTKR